jgi:acyl carrier protein
MMDDFYNKLAGALDLDEVKPGDVLEDLPDWDSLAAFTVIAMIGSTYGVHLKAAELRSLGSAENLRNHVASNAKK